MNLPTIAIAVLERGFVYVGHVSQTKGFLTLSHASNVRRWGTSRGLGELAQSGPLPNTVLDPCPTVFIPTHALIHLIACDEAKWTTHVA